MNWHTQSSAGAPPLAVGIGGLGQTHGPSARVTHRKRWGTLIAVLTVIFVSLPTLASGCAVCFGDSQSPMAQGMNKAIIALLGITGFMLSLFVAFFIFLWKRGRTAARQPDIDTAWLDGLRGAKHG